MRPTATADEEHYGARAGISTLRGAISPGGRAGRGRRREGRTRCWPSTACSASRVGVDIIEPPVMFALQAAGHRRGRRPAGVPRGPPDQDPGRDRTAHPGGLHGRRRVRGALRVPAPRACGRTSASGWSARCSTTSAREHVEGVNAISGERCSPHPHVFSDRLIRPGDPAFFDILHSLSATGPATTARSRWAARPRRSATPTRSAASTWTSAIALVKPGATTADIVAVWPTAPGVRVPRRGGGVRACSTGTASGCASGSDPIFSRLISLDHPEVLEEGMVFALETYWPADGRLGRGPHRGGARRHRRRL